MVIKRLRIYQTPQITLHRIKHINSIPTINLSRNYLWILHIPLLHRLLRRFHLRKLLHSLDSHPHHLGDIHIKEVAYLVHTVIARKGSRRKQVNRQIYHRGIPQMEIRLHRHRGPTPSPLSRLPQASITHYLQLLVRPDQHRLRIQYNVTIPVGAIRSQDHYLARLKT